jgi:nicotinate dehydrogenase subunit A
LERELCGPKATAAIGPWQESRRPKSAVLHATLAARFNPHSFLDMPDTQRLSVNGKERAFDAAPDTPLLYLLRNDLDLKAAKFGCGLGQCGSCTVLIDGRAQLSCDVPLWSAAGKAVVTLEGLADTRVGAALQRAFVEHQAAQCGYCIPGMMVAAAGLLEKVTKPTEAEIRAALQRNLCRCGTHVRILRAIRAAAAELAK